MSKKNTSNTNNIKVKKYPNLNRRLHKLNHIINISALIYIIFAITLIAIVILSLYHTLPDDIKIEVSSIAGAILTIIVMPFILNYFERIKNIKLKRFESNKDIYIQLSKILINLVGNDDYNQNDINKLKNFLTEHYGEMCISFSTSLISNIYMVYDAGYSHNIKNIKYFSEQCIREIRKEFGCKQSFNFSKRILELIKNKI